MRTALLCCIMAAVAAVVMAAFLVAPPPAQGNSENSAGNAMITDNPDGTFTIRKESPKGTSAGSKVTDGLAIPPQVVVPIVVTRGKRP